jgi:hypothetical protein
MTDVINPASETDTPAAPMTRNQQYVAQMVAARVVAKAKSITDEMRAIADQQLIDNFNFPG